MISVIVPLFNKEISISKTINSILAQTFQNLEIIVVNDGSTDKSFEVVNEIKDPRIRILTQQNNGVSRARNRGVLEARYEYIALLDADDLWHPDFLEEMGLLIKDFPEAALYGSAYSFQHFDSNIKTPDMGLVNLFRNYVDYFVLAKNNTLFTSSSVIFRRDAFIEIGEFDVMLTKGEDIDLWIRFALNKKVAFYNKPMVIYKLDGENRANNRSVSKKNSLISNLGRYKNYENTVPGFKEFLDNWRLAHIGNYLNGVRNEVDEIRSLLQNINLKNYSLVWTILKYTPRILQPFIYKIWNRSRMLYR